jgi:hypothetical protein
VAGSRRGPRWLEPAGAPGTNRGGHLVGRRVVAIGLHREVKPTRPQVSEKTEQRAGGCPLGDTEISREAQVTSATLMSGRAARSARNAGMVHNRSPSPTRIRSSATEWTSGSASGPMRCGCCGCARCSSRCSMLWNYPARPVSTPSAGCRTPPRSSPVASMPPGCGRSLSRHGWAAHAAGTGRGIIRSWSAQSRRCANCGRWRPCRPSHGPRSMSCTPTRGRI